MTRNYVDFSPLLCPFGKSLVHRTGYKYYYNNGYDRCEMGSQAKKKKQIKINY